MMRTWRWVSCAAVVAASSAAGQQAVWTGTLVLPNGASVPVEFSITTADDTVAVAMQAADGPVRTVTGFSVDHDRLTFQWGTFTCSLTLTRETRYEGPCELAEGGTGRLTLTAPIEDRDRLTGEDLAATGASNVYEALERLRPTWLRPRAPAVSLVLAEVHVYLDDQPFGDVESLRSFEPDVVREVRFYTATEAVWRWGRRNTGGVILVMRRRPG